MDGRQGTDLVDLVRPRVTIPAYDDGGVFTSPLSDFLAEMRRRAVTTEVRTVVRGETASLSPQRFLPGRSG